jgi:uncharacterized protein
MYKQLSIGTAQFGFNYGISNISGRVKSTELNLILRYMEEIKLFEFDTAQTYGESESLIAKLLASSSNFSNAKIVTKFSLSKHYESGDIEKLVKISLSNLNVTTLFGVLLHNFNDYKNSPELWKEMLRLRSLGVIENIGFSIYYPEELDFILKSKVDFDIIQIPFNIFDRRFKRYFTELDSRNVLIYFRSIFMQGLVFLDPEFINQKLDLAKKYIQSLRSISFDSGIDINSLCLNYALSQNSNYKIIIGVTSSAELKKNISLINEFNKSHEVFERLDNLKINDNELDIIIKHLIKIQVEKINNKQ